MLHFRSTILIFKDSFSHKKLIFLTRFYFKGLKSRVPGGKIGNPAFPPCSCSDFAELCKYLFAFSQTCQLHMSQISWGTFEFWAFFLIGWRGVFRSNSFYFSILSFSPFMLILLSWRSWHNTATRWSNWFFQNHFELVKPFVLSILSTSSPDIEF